MVNAINAARAARCLVYILLFCVMAFPVGCAGGVVSLEANTKGNIYIIQNAVEKYAARHGEYPPYVLGGDYDGWEKYKAEHHGDENLLLDPLIEGGYLFAYPKVSYKAHTKYRGKNARIVDRFVEEAGKLSGGSFDPRFGLNGDRMGNVLSEPIIFVKQVIPELEGYPRLCPGMFYYKALGTEISDEEEADSEIISLSDIKYKKYNAYVIGGMGDSDMYGLDTIRWLDGDGTLPDSFPYISRNSYYATAPDSGMRILLALPEVVGGGGDGKMPEWPPFDPPEFSPNEVNVIAGAPDGFADGVVTQVIGGKQ